MGDKMLAWGRSLQGTNHSRLRGAQRREGGSRTIQSSVEQKPSEACTSEQMQVLLMNLSEQGGRILETEIRVVKMKQLLFIVQRENRLDETWQDGRWIQTGSEFSRILPQFNKVTYCELFWYLSPWGAYIGKKQITLNSFATDNYLHYLFSPLISYLL